MASPLEWITGVGGAVSGVVNGLFQHKQNKDNLKAQQEENEKNRQFNAAQANLAYQRSVQQWQRENAYNTPAAQRGRLQAAGMNPDLAYDGASGAMASYSGSSVASSSGGISPITPVSFSEAFNNILQSRLLESQIKNIDADTEGKEIDNNWKDTLNGVEYSTKSSIYQLNDAMRKLTNEQRKYVAKEVDNYDTTLEEVRSRIKLNGSSALEKEQNAKIGIMEEALRKATYDYDVELSREEVKKVKAEIKSIYAQIENFIKTGKQMDLDFKNAEDYDALSRQLGIVGSIVGALADMFGVGASWYSASKR